MLDDFYNWMLATGKSEGTARLYVGRIRQLELEHPNLLAVTLADLERYIADRRELAAETRKSIKSAFCSFYKWAHRMGLVSANPTELLDPVHVPATVPRVAPDDVVQMGLLTAPQDLAAMIMLARFGCLRLAELTTLHTRQREHDTLRIRGKGEKMRLVPMNDELMAAMLTLERDHGQGYYFPGRYGAHLHTSSVNKMITRHLGTNPHSLRHAGATAAYRATGDLRAVQMLLGHASIATTQRYLHIGMDAVKRAADGTAFVVSIRSWPTTTLPSHAAA